MPVVFNHLNFLSTVYTGKRALFVLAAKSLGIALVTVAKPSGQHLSTNEVC